MNRVSSVPKSVLSVLDKSQYFDLETLPNLVFQIKGLIVKGELKSLSKIILITTSCFFFAIRLCSDRHNTRLEAPKQGLAYIAEIGFL